MEWASKWVGLPQKKLGRGPDAYDCMGLFIALHKDRFGRDIPDPECTMQSAVRQGVVDALRSRVVTVEPGDVREGDALLFLAVGRPLHIGFALNRNLMLHIERSTSLIEKWTGPRWAGRLEGIYRFV